MIKRLRAETYDNFGSGSQASCDVYSLNQLIAEGDQYPVFDSSKQLTPEEARKAVLEAIAKAKLDREEATRLLHEVSDRVKAVIEKEREKEGERDNEFSGKKK